MPEHDASVPQPETAPDAAEPMLTVDATALEAGGRGVAERRAMYLSLQRSAGNAAVSRLLRTVAPPSVGTAPEAVAAAGLLIVDAEATAPAPQQMRQDEFLDEVARAAGATAEEALAGTVFTAAGCPWIEHWIDYYRVRSAAELERAVHRYAPATATAESARDCVPLICERIREGIAAWRESGQIPPIADGGADLSGVAVSAAATPSGALARTADEAAARLGPGRWLEPSLRRRMETAFGADFSSVQVHTDPAAGKAARGVSARAFAYGSHVAFAPGAYEPGTPLGDALIAHELAHVVQQGEATSASATGSSRDAEHEASAAALAVVRGGPARPRLTRRLGLSLQACTDVPRRPRQGERRTGQDATDAIEEFAIRLVSDRDVERAPVGFHGKYHVEANTEVVGRVPGPDDGSLTAIEVGPWYCHPPHDPLLSPEPTRSGIARRSSDGPEFEYPFDVAGDWIVTARVFLPDGSFLEIDHPQRIVSLGSVAATAFGQVGEPADAIRHRAALELQIIEAGRGAVEDQNLGAGPYISLGGSGRNPIRPQAPFAHQSYTYQRDPHAAEDVPHPTSYRWYAIPESGESVFPPGYGGHPTTEYDRRFAFELGERRSARLHIEQPDVYDIVCEPVDERGERMRPQIAHYRQVVLTEREGEVFDRLRSAVREHGERLAMIVGGSEQGLRATHTSSETGQSNELALFVGRAREGDGYLLVDLTPGVERSEYSGETLQLAVDDFESANTYPPGMVILEGDNVSRRRFTTSGASALGEASAGFGWASLGLAALGAVALFTPAFVVAPYLFAASAATGVTASTLSIADELRNNEPNELRIAIDVVGIAGSIVGAGAIARGLASGSAVTMSRGARFMMYSELSLGVVEGALVSVHAATQIDAILEQVDRRAMTREEANVRIVQLLAMLAVTGGLIAYGARDLRGARTRLGTAIGQDAVTRRLPADVLHNLDALDDAAIGSLAGLRVDELEAVARVIGTNREGARRLSELYGPDFVARARGGGFESVEQLAADLGSSARRRAQPEPSPDAPTHPDPPAVPPRSVQPTEHGRVDATGRPDDAIAVEHQMAPDAHGEPHVLHMTEAGVIYRCSESCVEILASLEERTHGVRASAARTRRALDIERNWRQTGAAITRAALKLRNEARALARAHRERQRELARSGAAGRAQLDAERAQWLAEANELAERAAGLERRMQALEDVVGIVPRATPRPPDAQPATLDDLRQRYDDLVRSDETLREEFDDIERARADPGLQLDVQRRIESLEERLVRAVEARVPEQIARAIELRRAVGSGLVSVTVNGRRTAKCRARAGSVQTVSGAHAVDGYEQRTREVLAHGEIIQHTFAPHNFDGRVANALNSGRPLAEHVGSGAARASHAEKQAALAAPGEPIGVSLPMCFDCWQFFVNHAANRGRPVVVADPDLVRVFYPDGRVLAPSHAGGTVPIGGEQP